MSRKPLRPCKVVIAGGGIVGLALAIMLEKSGVDYILLEAYSEIVAKAGAGIFLMANGLRVLDQLGCYENLLSKAGDAMEVISYRDPNGESLSTTDGWGAISSERYGYSSIWVGRTELLQAMYDCVVDTSKLLTGKRVECVRDLEDGVEVTTTDGSNYRGDILIGADGIHSRVRDEMVRYATEQGAGQEYNEDHKIPAKYQCLFGMSAAIPGLPRGYLAFGLNEGFSNIVGTGPENRTYWFLAQRMDKTYFGDEIPRFTEEDKEQMVKAHWDDKITPEVRFSDLYKNKLGVILTALREFVYRRWHLNRMIVLGDASLKMSPILGQGGNQALESAAAMTNSLMDALARPLETRLSTAEIDSMFAKVQRLREPQARKMMKESHLRQRMEALETPELADVMMHKFLKRVPWVIFDRWDAFLPSAVYVKSLTLPQRRKLVPFDDEVRAKL